MSRRSTIRLAAAILPTVVFTAPRAFPGSGVVWRISRSGAAK